MFYIYEQLLMLIFFSAIIISFIWILFIAHDLSVVNHISTEIAVMYLGEVVEFNKTAEIFNNPQHDYTKLLRDTLYDN